MIVERLKAEIESLVFREPSPTTVPVVINPAPSHVNADVSIPWPLGAGKARKKNPLGIAQNLAQLLKDAPGVAAAEAVPPGFINIIFSPAALGEELSIPPSELGRDPSLTEKRSILLEYVSANPTGPVHLASSRAAALGDSLARILRRRGHEVRTEYYVNDAGNQVEKLGLSVQARWDQRHGKDTPLPEKGYQGDYIADIAKAAPPEAASWGPTDFSRFAIETMLAQHEADIAAYGVSFDRWYRESELHAAGAVDAALAKLKSLGKAYEHEGAVWLGSAAEGTDDKDRVLVRADGRPTYFLADIAYHEDKFARGAKELIDIWGADHHGYVPRMKAAMAALGHPPGAFHAIVHQLVHLFRGQEAVKMSKRAGEFITLRELVEMAGLDACRFFFAMRSPNSHMNFDVELARKQSNENPVFYVQYVHARISSIFREAAKAGVSAKPAASLLTEDAERALLVKLAWLPQTLAACEKELSPHPLPTYLMELAGLYHKFYEKCRVLDPAEPARSAARLALCGAVRTAIAEGLGLLGVSAPSEM